jgi:hypothetical protein
VSEVQRHNSDTALFLVLFGNIQFQLRTASIAPYPIDSSTGERKGHLQSPSSIFIPYIRDKDARNDVMLIRAAWYQLEEQSQARTHGSCVQIILTTLVNMKHIKYGCLVCGLQASSCSRMTNQEQHQYVIGSFCTSKRGVQTCSSTDANLKADEKGESMQTRSVLFSYP